MQYIDELFRKKAACTAIDISKKIKLSRSRTMEFLHDMKKFGFPINYSRKDKCYYYEKQGRMTKELFEKSDQ